MYHPAAALYQGSLRETLLADFAKLPKLLKLIKSGKANPPEAKEVDSSAKPASSSKSAAKPGAQPKTKKQTALKL
jgi:DNA polymerase